MGANKQGLIRNLSAGAIGVAGFVGLMMIAFAYFGQKMNGEIDHPDADESVISQECVSDPSCDNPTILIKLAQAMSGGNESERELARQLLERAMEEDQLQPLAYAIMSYLHTKDAGELTSEAIAALQRSVEICRLCDNQELLRWRLEFVLRNWEAMPEDLRQAATEGADVLRWRYEDEEFLAEQDAYALRNAVPFTEYVETLVSPEIPDLRSP